jgi:hypothetical protein
MTFYDVSLTGPRVRALVTGMDKVLTVGKWIEDKFENKLIANHPNCAECMEIEINQDVYSSGFPLYHEFLLDYEMAVEVSKLVGLVWHDQNGVLLDYAEMLSSFSNSRFTLEISEL